MGLGAWVPGDTSLVVTVICCPACGSLEVLYYGKPESSRKCLYWRCVPCSHRWKGTKEKIGRATVI